jgi:TonB-dependent SusC/RagA subfamily outer membrane receptor
MKRATKLYAILGILLLTSWGLNAQENPVEKIYTQTDRPFYFPGEIIWFKSYVVLENNQVSSISDVLYAELISPKGSVVKKILLPISQGYAYGDIEIQKEWVGGVYRLKTYTNWMRNFGEEAIFTKDITVQKIVKPNLLLSLKFEKEGYGQSSKVQVNFNAKNLNNNPLQNKKIRYTVAAKGVTLVSEKSKTDAQGNAVLNFQLPDDLSTRDVVLNVQVDYRGSTESISRSVPVVLDTIDLQFLPEGGRFVANANNRIAFKALNEFGKPVDVQGTIFDNQGNLVKSFDSFHDGMGSFDLNPSVGNSYYAMITAPFQSKQKIPLPDVNATGVNIRVTTDSLTTQIAVESSLSKALFLTVSNASTVLSKQPLNITNGTIDIPTASYPMGIAKFTITDENDLIQAERLAFLNAHKQLQVSIKLDKEIYKTRERVVVKIKTTDENNHPVPSNLSVAIADNKLLSFADDKQDHILSSLLLSSELKGKIYKPNFYFNPKEKKSYEAIDYVMLTHGWRDYIVRPKKTNELKYLSEKLSIQTGQVVDRRGKPVQAHLMLFNPYGKEVMVFETDQDGLFSFKFDKWRHLILVAYTDSGKRLVILDKQKTTTVFSPSTSQNNPANDKKLDKEFSKFSSPVRKTLKKKATASVFMKESSQQLDEVVVTSYGRSLSRKSTSACAGVMVEEVPFSQSLDKLLMGRVAGISVQESSGTFSNQSSVVIRGTSSLSGNGSPLIIVDGVPYDFDKLSDLTSDEIRSIDILKSSAATSIYGSVGANGVILVQTKNGQTYSKWGRKVLNNRRYKNYATRYFHSGTNPQFYYTRDFYIPKYSGEEIPEERTDFRQTIYWNPIVQTDENGEAEFDFPNSDAVTSFKIVAEGVGYNGLVGRQEKLYATQKTLSLNLKMPNYMTVNDTVQLPITITNKTEQELTTKLDVQLPKHLKLLGSHDSEVSVGANSSEIRYVSVIPIKKAASTKIQVRVASKELSDYVTKEATIVSPYFPTEISISGSKSNAYSFSIDNAVPKSVRADFTLYTDIIGDVMDGIESMLREPHGCFEQTSSSTYPNIMVLKYLQENGKSNIELEEKALNYIQKGYQRLISFETEIGGFEWFGKTPPHETLTAYGILEFTEMKEVFSGVDQRMIDRTVKWLLNRRNGKGGFKKSKEGYDSFKSSPKNVANAYIVYALSEAKVEADFTKEYEFSYQGALQSRDTYRMALLACASFNLGKTDRAKALIELIKENIDTYGFAKLPVENTITRSYGNSKNIETVAFSLLALMKQGEVNEFLVAQGIDHLINNRKHNRFGSTQATCIALKALIEYTKTQKAKLVKNKRITLTVNGKKLTKDLRMTNNGKIIMQGISSLLTEGKQTVDIQFSGDEASFPYSLNVQYESFLPASSENSPLLLETVIAEEAKRVGDDASMQINVRNKENNPLGMVTAVIGIPSGTTPDPKQLKKLLDETQFAYYEIFENYLVFYWRSFAANETKTLRLDLKADVPGRYQAPASTAYLYYGDEYKTWIEGSKLEIKE